MRKRLQALQSLRYRLLVPLFLTVGLVLAVYSVFNFRSTKKHFLDVAEAEIHRNSDLIRRATHDGMLLNRLGEVQVTLERLAESPDVAAVRIFDKKGSIVLSGERSEIGTAVPLEVAPCSTCHAENEPLERATQDTCRLRTVSRGTSTLRHLAVIENEASCSSADCHAHPSNQPILGVLDVEIALTDLEAALHSSRLQLIWATLALVIILGVVSLVFIRVQVLGPVDRLSEGTARISNGDLSRRIEVKGQHELANLAKAFNDMTTDLSRARSELTHWSQTLEEKVVEKTEELQRAQRQVLQMEKMASLGKLSATVAHELNNPLSGVLTYARLIEREISQQPVEPSVRQELLRHLGVIEKECSRCGGIVKNLLLFARGSGAEMAPVDLNEIIERSLMLVRHHLEISGIRLNSQLLAGDSHVEADAGQLQQAIVALLVNAIEAMEGPDQDRQLTVRATGDATEVQIEITDTGVGISPEARPHIFEPFFSTKDKESGVGLGLAVVYGIVRRHGGSIEVDSKLSRGATFRITLPRKPRAMERQSPYESAAPV